MTGEMYRIKFGELVPFSDVHDSVIIAVYAAEGLHGKSQVLLDAAVWLDEQRRSCVVDASTPVGQAIARVLLALLQRVFGEDAFEVDRVAEPPATPAVDVAATDSARD